MYNALCRYAVIVPLVMYDRDEAHLDDVWKVQGVSRVDTQEM